MTDRDTQAPEIWSDSLNILIPPHRPPLQFVSERDLDLVLLQEIHASSDFRSFLLEKVLGEAGQYEFYGAWNSVFDANGESDLLVLVSAAQSYCITVMIENKIDAPFQQDQCGRYRLRGAQGITEGWWSEYRTCLIGPDARLPAHRADWDACISIEQLVRWFEEQQGERSRFQAGVLRQAVKKAESGNFIVNDTATSFWRQYAELCRCEFPDLTMKSLSKEQSRNEPWPQFAQGSLPKGIRLEHKAWLGRVDLIIEGRSQHEVLAATADCLPAGVYVEKAGGSAAIRVGVPKLAHLQSFEQQVETVRKALSGARLLLRLWPSIRNRLRSPG